MRAFIRRLLPYIARLHPNNWRRDRRGYPQLWYCMPSRFYTKGEYWRHKDRCTYCGNKIKGQAAYAANNPSWPAPVYWCGLCPKPESFHPADTILTGKMPRPEPVRRKRIVGYWLRPLIQMICGWLSGHEPSRTEWGYGGGKFVDRNCRWCDQLLRVPIAEDPPPNDLLAGLASKM